MKDYAWLWVLGSLLFLGLVGGFSPSNAYAGDDPVTQLSLSVDGGTAIACTSTILSKGQYAVQPGVAAYVAVTNTNDGGVGVIDSTKHAKIPADALYDIWVTSDKPYICCKPAAAGAASSCKILKYREF